MVRFITNITCIVFGVLASKAQEKSEEIMINNLVIQLPGTLTYTLEKQPLLIWVHGS